MQEVMFNSRGLRRLVVSVISALLFVVATSACATSPHLDDVDSVKESDLLGAWKGVGGSVLILKSGNKFEAHSLKTSYTAGAGVHVESEEVVSGAGEWAFGHYSKDWMVDLWFEPGGSATLYVASDDGEKVIWAWVGDGEPFVMRR
ncbi:hypothetical protein [Streptomyces sp. NPDC013181]|uniref:hypothetical protein n=1 Tax=unclassified Streptomyces TaxID=2593676 RepID=UPI0036A4098B